MKGNEQKWTKHPFGHSPRAHLNLGPLVHQASVLSAGPHWMPILIGIEIKLPMMLITIANLK